MHKEHSLSIDFKPILDYPTPIRLNMNAINTVNRKIKTMTRNPKVILIKLLYAISPMLPDKLYLKLLFPLKTGYSLNLSSPRTYNEKLQWLKLNFREPIMTIMADKYEAKKLIASKVGADYVLETYGVWDSFDVINFDALPEQFVLKTTHDQGGVIVVKDKAKFDVRKARSDFNKRLRKNCFLRFREWPYKNIKPRIIAEKLLVDSESDDLYDYKFYCFNGQPKVMYIASGRQVNKNYFDFFDMQFNRLEIERPGHPNSPANFLKPHCWNEMIELSKKLATGFLHVRIDFYQVNKKLYVGELTFFQGGGMMPFIPKEWDMILGDYILLPK